jgi:AraC family transcriptional regulator of adaptative response/methylated-DNA-[protein]-cysteine methyltransferase
MHSSNQSLKDNISQVLLIENPKHKKRLFADWIESPLGEILCITDTVSVLILEFIERRDLARKLSKFRHVHQADIQMGHSAPLVSITDELRSYFQGTLTEFKTPLNPIGTPFQMMAWKALLNIPYGSTLSYGAQAKSLGRPTAFRAVAGANSCNPIAIAIPCHRIINNNGDLGGYAGGIDRKAWLLAHEKI